MKYSCKRILNYIRQNIIIYLMLIVATSLGMCILFCCKIVLDKANDDIVNAKKYLANQIIRVEFFGSMLTEPTADNPYPVAVSAQRYQEIAKEYSDNVDIGFSPYELISIDDFEQDNILSDWIFFMNDVQFEMLFGQKMPRETIFASGNNYNNIKDFLDEKQSSVDYNKININSTGLNFLKILNGEIYILEKDKVQLAYTPQSTYASISHHNPGATEHDFKLQDALIVSYDYYPAVEKHIKERIDKFRALPADKRLGVEATMPMCVLNVKLKEQQNIDTLPLLVSFLNDNDSNYTFKMDVNGEREQQTLENLQNKFMQYQVAAITMIIIVVTISFGTVIINLQKRRKSVAVAMVFGATKKKIMLELFFELFFVNLISGIVAVVATKTIIPYLQGIYFGVKMNMGLFIFVTSLIVFVFSLLPTIIAFINVGQMNVCEILKDGK